MKSQKWYTEEVAELSAPRREIFPGVPAVLHPPPNFLLGGPIRFVGGPWHNRHYPVSPWRVVWRVPVRTMPVIRYCSPEDIPKPNWRAVDYDLHQARSECGAIYWEYRLRS